MATYTRDNFTYEEMKDIAEYLAERTKIKPKFGIICGSGLGTLVECLTDTDTFEYKNIPNFLETTVQGHSGRMVFGNINGNTPVVAMQGRFHYYEGYPLPKCSMPVCVMKLLGVEYLMATNAAGGINPKFKTGDIMIIRDHINVLGMAGNSPLRGPNKDELGPRFPAMANCYDPEIIRIAKKVAKTMDIEKEVHEGVYTALGGPSYETIAELRSIRCWGGDAVGMSTANEVITARHCGITVFAFSLITNSCTLEYEKEETIDHTDVVETGKLRQTVCIGFLTNIIKEIVNSTPSSS